MEEKIIKEDNKVNPDKEYSIVVPQRVLKIRRFGKVSEEKVPVFKGYIFIETNSFSEKVYRSIKKLKGVYRFLPSNDLPKPIYGRDLDILNHFLKLGGLAKISLVSFDEQDRIQIIEGPLKGLEGQIIKVDKRKGRAKVRIDAYQNSFEVDFGFSALDITKKNAGSN